MKWIEDIATAFPKPRDDEPAGLRLAIVKELRDHLECAWRRELLKTGDETEARRRVLARFGDPKRVARRLWLDAMQEKIMSQRILMFWSGLMAAACVAAGVFVCHVVEQSAESNRALIKTMLDANRELVEQGRALNAALIERLDRRPLEREAAPAPQALIVSPTEDAVESNSGDWIAVRLKLIKDNTGGEPAVGYTVVFSNASNNSPALYNAPEGPSGSTGQFDAGVLRPGDYNVCVTTPWGEWAHTTVTIDSHKPSGAIDIICPGTAPLEFNVSLEIDWPDDLRGRNLGLLFYCENLSRDAGGRKWFSPKSDGLLACEFLLTSQGVMLQGGDDWRGRAALRAREPTWTPVGTGGLWMSPGSADVEEEGTRQITMKRATARPTSVPHWIGNKYYIQVKGVVIISEPLEAYPRQHVLVDEPEGDSTEIWSEFDPDQSNPRITIPISPALAVNVRRVLEMRPLPPEIASDWNGARISYSLPVTNSGPDSQPNRPKPHTAEALLEKATQFAFERADDRALEFCSKAIKANLKFKDAYIFRGSLRSRMNKPSLAVEDFTEAIRLDPKHASDAYSDRGATWTDTGELDKALADYTEAIRLDPNSRSAYVSRARIWVRKGETRKALEEYSAAIRTAEKETPDISQSSAPANVERGWVPPPYMERAAIMVELGELDNAIGAYAEMIKEGYNVDEAHIARGNLWWKKKNLDKALQDFTEAVRKDENSEAAHNALAWFLATADDRKYRNAKRALEHASRACELTDWHSSDCFDTLAAAHAEAGSFELAAAWQSKVLEIMQGAKEKPSPADVKRAEQRLELYRSGKPYREEVGPGGT